MISSKGCVAGIWKFVKGISQEELVALAKEAANGPDGERYLLLLVRGTSGDGQYGVEFIYRLDQESGETHRKYMHRISDALKRRFGNDLLGWDISSDTTFVRYVALTQ